MFRKPRTITILRSLVVVIILLVTTGTLALAQGGGWGDYTGGSAQVSGPQAAPTVVPGGPGFYQVNTYEFIPYFSTVPLPNRMTQFSYNQTGAANEYIAPVSLPNGVTVTKVVLFYKDNEPVTNLSANLYRVDVLLNSVQLLAQLTSSGADAAYRYLETSTISNAIVDTQSYVYVILANLPSSPGGLAGINGVRIDYGYSTSLPAVLR